MARAIEVAKRAREMRERLEIKSMDLFISKDNGDISGPVEAACEECGGHDFEALFEIVSPVIKMTARSVPIDKAPDWVINPKENERMRRGPRDPTTGANTLIPTGTVRLVDVLCNNLQLRFTSVRCLSCGSLNHPGIAAPFAVVGSAGEISIASTSLDPLDLHPARKSEE